MRGRRFAVRVLGCHQRANLLSGDDADDVALFTHAEDHHRHIVVAAQRNGCRVHHAKILTQDVVISDLVEAFGVRIFLWIGRVDAIDGGGLQEDVGLDLHGAKSRGSVSREERISGPGGEDDDAALFKMTQRTATDVGLGDLVHLNCAHDAAIDASFLNSVLQRDGVDHGGKHAHVVGGNAVHIDGLLGNSAKEVTSPHHDADLAAQGMYGCKLFGYFVNENSVNSETTTRGQSFA